ncbi:GNAT family N-acetyltransferase [Actinopolymorpha pittospori]|uniref:GNAT superfamily N-acetyltransferase n=1 Tax=Actinopolymorpha pittospori TaxID=648752 RepID=A0A927MTQ8_9ACTN|nr:GNAT superfamily N-acetyltransferase [Actinopolymorpha pittospori]
MNATPDTTTDRPAGHHAEAAGDAPRTIRRVSGEELLTSTYPMHAYAFGSTPPPTDQVERWRADLAPADDRVTLVAFTGEEPEATAVGISLRQNVRGKTLPMLGVSGVATHPMARRRGHIRAVLTQLHGEMRDSGHVVSTLYPFRQSFYERFGYVGFPKARAIRLHARGLERMLRADVPGEVTFHRIGEVFDDYYAATEAILAERHGFSIFSKQSTQGLAKEDKHWAVFARHEDEIVGTLLYRTNGFGAELQGRHLLARNAVGRSLLLQWLARHHDQYASFTFELPPDERPDLWYVDLDYADETKVSGPLHSAPMGRILSVEGLAGIGAGPARASVEVVDDPFVAGTWTLTGVGGALEVQPGGTPTATLTPHGLAALVYGVLDPAELSLQGYGTVDADTAAALRTLFPPAMPYLHAAF